MYANPNTERIFQSRYHSTCKDCGRSITIGDMVRYTPAKYTRWVRKQQRAHDGHIYMKDVEVGKDAIVRHAEGQCPAVMDYTVQLLYASTSKLLKVRALSAVEAIDKAKPKRIAIGTTGPCGFVVRQGNVEVLRRAA